MDSSPQLGNLTGLLPGVSQAVRAIGQDLIARGSSPNAADPHADLLRAIPDAAERIRRLGELCASSGCELVAEASTSVSKVLESTAARRSLTDADAATIADTLDDLRALVDELIQETRAASKDATSPSSPTSVISAVPPSDSSVEVRFELPIHHQISATSPQEPQVGFETSSESKTEDEPEVRAEMEFEAQPEMSAELVSEVRSNTQPECGPHADSLTPESVEAEPGPMSDTVASNISEPAPIEDEIVQPRDDVPLASESTSASADEVFGEYAASVETANTEGIANDPLELPPSDPDNAFLPDEQFEQTTNHAEASAGEKDLISAEVLEADSITIRPADSTDPTDLTDFTHPTDSTPLTPAELSAIEPRASGDDAAESRTPSPQPDPVPTTSRDAMFDVLELDTLSGLRTASAAETEATAPVAESSSRAPEETPLDATSETSFDAAPDAIAPTDDIPVDDTAPFDAASTLDAIPTMDPGKPTDLDAAADEPSGSIGDNAFLPETSADPVQTEDTAANTLPSDPTPADLLQPLAASEPSREFLTDEQLWELLEEAPSDAASAPLALQSAQQELLPDMITDLRLAGEEIAAIRRRLEAGEVQTVASDLAALGPALQSTTQFFGFASLASAAELLAAMGDALPRLDANLIPEIALRLLVIDNLFTKQSHGLQAGICWNYPFQKFLRGTLSLLAAPSQASSSAAPSEFSEDQLALLNAVEQEAATWGTTPLTLPAEKADLLQFCVSDVKEAAEQITPLVPELGAMHARAEVSSELIRISGVIERATSEFDFRSLKILGQLVGDIGFGLGEVQETMMPELEIRLRALQSLISQHATALEVGMETTWPLETLRNRVHRILSGQVLSSQILGWHKNDTDRVIELDGVSEGLDNPPRANPGEDEAQWHRPDRSSHAVTDTIRVESGVIDGLLDTIGELVQHRGRLQLLSDALHRDLPNHPQIDELVRTSERIERAMVKLQSGVMGTRLQYLSKLFDRYPRIVRDVARLADKEVELTSNGGSTLVDKTIIDHLGDPLTSVLRNIASKLIEPPSLRAERGKPAQGRIVLNAQNQGSQIVVTVEDDGAGLDRADCERQVVYAGLLAAEAAAAASDEAIFTLMLDARVRTSPLCTVEQQVRSSLNGTVSITSEAGKGSRVEFIIPMKSAILAAVSVAVGSSIYNIPLQGIIEITRIVPQRRKTIAGSPCLILREQVLPLLSAHEIFGDDVTMEPEVAIIITNGTTSAALAVDRVIDNHDIVIRSIEEAELRRGPFSGASLSPEGRVCFVLDVQRVLSATVSRNAPSTDLNSAPASAALTA